MRSVLSAVICGLAYARVQSQKGQFYKDVIPHDVEGTPRIVLFHVPWCQWCRRFEPVFDQIERLMRSTVLDRPKPVFYKFNMESSTPSELEELNITRYPVLRLLQSSAYGEPHQTISSEYRGPLDFHSTVQWIAERLTMDMEVTTPTNLDLLLNIHSSSSAVFFVNPTPKMLDLFRYHLDKSDEDVMFAIVKESKVVHALIDRYTNITDDLAVAQKLRAQRAEGISVTQPFLLLLNPHTPGVTASARASLDLLLEGVTEDEEPQPRPRGPFQPLHGFGQNREFHAHFFPATPMQDAETLLADPDSVNRFVNSFEFPALFRWNYEMGNRLVASNRPFMVAFLPSSKSVADDFDEVISTDNDPREDIIDALWVIGNDRRHKMATIVSGTERMEERRLMSALGVTNAPALIYVKLEPDQMGVKQPTHKWFLPESLLGDVLASRPAEHSKMNSKMASTAIITWLENIEAGKVEPYIKSEEPLPNEANAGPVYQLTARDFDQRVRKSGENWLVDFYAPWCGHCRVLAPTVERVARAFREARVKNVKFGKVDATMNEVVGITLSGYPTLLWFDREGNPPVAIANDFHSGKKLAKDIATEMKIGVLSIWKALEALEEDDDMPHLLNDGEL